MSYLSAFCKVMKKVAAILLEVLQVYTLQTSETCIVYSEASKQKYTSVVEPCLFTSFCYVSRFKSIMSHPKRHNNNNLNVVQLKIDAEALKKKEDKPDNAFGLDSQKTKPFSKVDKTDRGEHKNVLLFSRLVLFQTSHQRWFGW